MRLYLIFSVVIYILIPTSSTQQLVQLRYEQESGTYATNSQPRMYTNDGNLIFEVGNGGYNISFKTNQGGGSVNLNDKDLTTLMSQITKNQDDIDDLKNSGGGTIPQDIIDQINTNKDNIASSQDQINQHNSKIQTLENNYASLKTTVDGIVADLQDDDCSGNPCSHGGTCVDMYKSYLCQCARQWQGPQCQADVNECSELSLMGLGCQNGGTCVNTQGSFRCDCAPEYFGSFCTSGYNDCSDGSDKCMHGLCVDGSRDQVNIPNYSCVCEDGWQSASSTDPTCSLDVNECLDTPCSRNPQVQCFNTPGSFTCGQCPDGYIGNGIVCTDIDECATNNGGCSTNPPVSCINQPGGNVCGPCPAGYTGDGRSCTTQDPCSTNNGGCHPSATCTTNPAIGPSYVQCTCQPGYSGNGIGPNGCTLNPTDCTSTCQNGACLDNGGGWQTCICDAGWSGAACDININECSSSPCQNGGTCTDAINGYTCTCANDFSGTNCQTQAGSCGAYYRQDSGAFSYPASIGQNYPNGASCAWVVEVSLGKIIQATFPVFDIEDGGSSCSNDFLQINEGNSASGHIIGKYCGSTVPGNPLLSSHNMLYFWFNSNSQTNGQGFQVVWQTTDPVCGGDISGQTFGDISSPGYPGAYPNNRDCYWTIQVEPGNIVQILFGTLDIEDEMSCSKDFLELRNGLTEGDDLLARYCGATIPTPVSTTSPGAWIYFHTDSESNAGGFHITWISQEVTGCGGYLTDNDGIITSPNWPNSYELNTECFWQIHVESTGRIMITFTDLDLEDHSACNYDYLEVHDGSSENSPFVARYCGTEVPPPYTSSGNDLWMKFRSDVSQTGSGFRLTYTVACGGIYTAPTGTLTSPFYPLPYPEDKECFYIINQTPGYVITLTFNDFNLEDHSSCVFDYIEIRDGPSEDSPLLSTLCGNSVPIPIESSTNYMWIHFYSDVSITGSGFSASYTTHYTGCGGVYTDLVGTFTSPGQPVPYPNGANCTYYIAVDPSLIINLHFVQFNLEEAGSSGCYDYIEIFDGEGFSSPSLGRYCGSVPPPALTSTSYELTVYFTADQSITTDGFVVSYTTANASLACGDRITDSEGYITSPQYPSNYLPSRTCVWTIQVETNMQIRVNFTDFALEAAGSDGTCIYDYLELRNGGYEDSALIGKYCGSDSPGIFVTHGNQLYIKFYTDPYTEDRGFLMFYDGSIRGCGGTLTSSNGYIESPNYPYPYAHNAECYWLIQVSQGSSISLQFNTFDLETHGYCSYDYVEVFDGPTPGYPMLQRICGTQIPQQFQSSDNSMMIKFKSDVNTAGSGFTAFYTTICDRTISGKASGVIQSLDYPDNYPSNLDCTWHIQGTYGNKINVSFNYFNMETCDNCGCDYLQIHDGADTSSGTDIGKYCGSTNPPVFLQSTSNDLLFNFHTDPYISAPGFEIIWAVDGCGATYTDSSGTLTSPNYPNNYPNSKECIWQIITSPGTSVKLTISVFDVEHHTTCDYDVLEVYNGLSTDSNNRLAQLCNVPNSQPNLPLVVSSTSTFMTVRFITDSSVNGRGFSATWEEQVGLCGGSFAASSGSITSPNYPNNYAANQDCEWYIDVGEGSTVILEFETFDTEPEVGCLYDYVAVYAGNSTSDLLLLKACGSAIPEPIQSPSHNIFVQFHSDPYSTHTGFKANFRSGCGGYLIASEDGAVTSPNYPDQYPSDTNCTWTILAPDIDGHVTLTMTHLDLYFNPDTNETACGNYDYLEIRDGPTLTSPTQGLYCGQTIPAPITSFSEALTVTMVSKSSYQASGFRALYTSATSRCGGDLTGRKGYFNSPGFPGPYPTYTSCVWTIQSSPGNGVHLQFLSFSLESHSSCYYDYLEVREGSETGPVLAKLCGSEPPSNLTSVNGHILYIKFQSDVSISGDGFQAYYEHVYGSTIIGQPNGTIASPMYPSNYPNYVDAKYYIYADFGNFISYQFQMFDLEQPASAGCIYDYLAIYDGDDVTSVPLMVSCGNAYQYGGQTTQDTMLIFFHSDWGLSARGFLLSWEQIEGGGIPPNPTNVPTISPGQCGAAQMVATTHPIYFQSPGWPIRYDHNLQCVWHIDAAENYAISALILEMELEGSEPNCVYDYVRFYNGETENDPLISQHCGRPTNLPISVVSMSNHMTVKFRTDSSVFYKGFNISYQQACGGFIQADLGVITSPAYPNNYPVDTDCYWEIISMIGSTLLVDVDPNFNIQNSDISTCNGTNGDFLELLNGRDHDAPPLTPNNGEGNGFYCGSTAPQNLQTQSNGLFVHFKSDSSGTSTGFSLTFSANRGTCGSLLTLTDQVTSSSFFSPDYPSTYPNGADCYWIITVPSNEAVQLDFTEFNVEYHQSCVFDYVRVIDGKYDDGEILGIFCGSDIPPTTRSTGNEMTVHFRSDPSVQSGGFKADYSIATCGGTIVGIEGEILSPEYPNSYPSSTTCEWRIRGPTYHYISFIFNDLQLNSLADGASCGDGSGDFIEFRTTNFTGPLLDVVCGSNPPLNAIETPDNEAFIRFVSDGSGTSTGFNITFMASEDECGGILNGPGGTLQTPNYPNVYDHARVCTWLITVADDRKVSLEFNAFDVEGSYGGVCYYDYVEIFNGINDNSPSLSGRFCGTDVPAPIFESTGNTMKVVFVTDASISNGGFLATYTSTHARVCGGRISGSEGGSFNSPNYPAPYGPNQECVWILENTNPTNSTIRLSFDSFSLENHPTCDYDYLSIKSGSTYQSPMIKKLCGTSTPADVGTAYGEMYVQFISDPYEHDTGFNANFEFTPCGGYISGQTGGILTSPNYPSPYNDHDYCLWTIAVAPGERVDLLWTDFEVELHNNCLYDYLKLFNGPTTDSPLIGTYCGDTQPTQFQSGGNSVTLLFQSDFVVTRGGWRAEWSTHTSGCGNVLYHDDTGTLTSPNFPDNYPHNSNCIWQILGKPSYHIEVTFDVDTFDIEYSGTCYYDYVALYDGAYEGDALNFAKYCGDSSDPNAPPSTAISSSSQDLTVRFRSDSSIYGTGFTMNWATVCGQRLSNEQGIIQSPNYPASYNLNERCEFLIIYEEASEKFIKLTFNALSIEPGSSSTICNYDYVNIYGGNTTTSAPLIGSFCGYNIPTTPITSQGSMLVVFNSDPVIIDYGFQATYESSDCGGLLTDPTGTINAYTHSDFHNNRNCTWQIQVSPDEKIVELKFASFDLETSSNCIYDYVAIYDGIDTSAPLIGKFCGSIVDEFIHSSGNSLTIEYVTDDLTTGDGFTAAYKTQTGPLEGCGGVLTDVSGTITNPDIDNDGKYDPDSHCVWRIQANPNSVINLHFNSFRLENESSPGVCIFDRLEIRDGSSYADPLALVTCGYIIPADFTSSSSEVTVRFISDPFIEDTGFEIQYSTQPQTCGGSYSATDNFQTITSPVLDNQPTGLNCRWILNAGDDNAKFIQIEFDSLNLINSQNPSDDCTTAYVEIRDFPLGDNGQVRRYCGSQIPDNFVSFQQVVQINLYTDASTSGNGFTLRYKLTTCSRSIQLTNGQLFSPGWPNPYAQNLNCEITIEAPVGNRLMFFFSFFDVEFQTNCDYDHLAIRDGLDSSSTLLAQLCGNYLPDPVFPSSNQAYINFLTDPYTEGAGYDITFTSSPGGNGGNFSGGDHGVVQNFMYPQPYEPNLDAEYSIRTPYGRPVTVHITLIDLFVNCTTGSCFCQGDTLTIYGGPTHDDPRIGGWCGYGTLTDLQSPTNGALLRLRTSDFVVGSRTNTGFRVDYES